MDFNVSSNEERGSLLNEQPDDKGLQQSRCLDTNANLFSACRAVTTGGEGSARHHDRDELLTNVAPSGGKNPKISSRQKTTHQSVFGTTHSQNSDGQLRSQSSPPGWSPGSSLPPPSGHDHWSQLHRRINRHRKTGSQCGKENIPPLLPRQPGKTYTPKARRPVLADVTKGGSKSFDEVSFAGSTSIQSPSRKVGNGEPGAAGLMFELDQDPVLDKSDSQETVTAQDSFVPIDIESFDRRSGCRPGSSPSTPLREALASFNDMFFSTFSSPAKKTNTDNNPPDTFRLSFRLPTPPLPTDVSLSNFNLSALADSVTQITGDIASSITARYQNDHLCHGQYYEDAVARDEKFPWEEEMRCLEIQCGK